MHCSPPSVAVIAAARQALLTNFRQGDALRARLLRRVARLREGLARIGARVLSALPLPVQTIALSSADAARITLAGLAARGIRALVTKTCSGGLGLSVILTAHHAAAQIDCLIDALAPLLRAGAHGERRMAMS